MRTPWTHAERAGSRRPLTWRTWVGLVLVPALLGGLLVWATWRPATRMEAISAAVVNDDKPVTVEGRLAPLGRLLSGRLVHGDAPNVTWVLTDAHEADAGLREARYSAVVRIPPSFSAAATSTGGDPGKAAPAKLEVRTSDDTGLVDRTVSQVVATAAAQAFGSDLTRNYLDRVYIGFTTLNQRLGEASDGARKLGDATGRLADGAGQLSQGTGDLASGLTRLAGGATQLATGSGSLAAGADALAAGTAGLDRVGELAKGSGAVAAGVRKAADGLSAQSRSLPALASGAEQVAGGLTRLDREAAKAAPALEALRPAAEALTRAAPAIERIRDSAKAVDGLSGAIAALVADCRANSTDDAYCDRLAARLTAVADRIVPPSPSDLAGLDRLAASTGELGEGLTRMTTGLPTLLGGISRLADGAQAVSAGVDAMAAGSRTAASQFRQLADGAAQVDQGVDALAAGVPALRAGVTRLSDGADKLSSGAVSLSNGLSQAAGGAGSLAGGAARLADGSERVDDGVGSLADGLTTAADSVPSYTKAERATLASTVATPVIAPLPDPDAGAPAGAGFFATLALWAGALATFLVLSAVPPRLARSRRSTGSLVGRLVVTVAGLAVIQAVLFAAVTSRVVGLGWADGLRLVGAMILIDAAFLLVNAALVALLGNAGRLVSALVLAVTLIAGTWAGAPAALTGLLRLLPTEGALRLLQAVLADGRQATAGVAGLAVWSLVAAGVLLLATERRRTIRLRPT